MLVGILNHIVDDDEVPSILHRLLDAVPAGSYLAVSHTTAEVDGEAMYEATRKVTEHGGTPVIPRSARQIAGFFDRVELLEPGVVSCSRWRPEVVAEDEPPLVAHFCAVGRKS